MHYLTTTMSKENSCCLIPFCHSCLAHNPSFHFCIWDILVPLLPPGYLGTIPTRPISQEPGFVYLLPTRLKLSWNTLQKELVQLRHSHGTLLFQVVAVPCGEAADCGPGSRVLSLAPHFPWLGLKEHFPALPAPSTTFVTGRNLLRKQESDLLRFCKALEEKLIWPGFWTWNYSSTSHGRYQSWTLPTSHFL